MLLAKYTDNGTSATLGWTQVAGGTGFDNAHAVAVNGSSVYITGYLTNNRNNENAVVFGGNGTTAGTQVQYGASIVPLGDIVVAKYNDNGNSGSYVWSQVGGGTDSDLGYSIAVKGNRLYVAGFSSNTSNNANVVVFGGSGTTAGTTTVNGATTTGSADVLLARYTDNGSTGTYDWAQVGGSSDTDIGYGLALYGQQVYVGGILRPRGVSTFGPTSIPAEYLTIGSFPLLTRLTDTDLVPLATAGGVSSSGVALYPNPATHSATVRGVTAGASVQLYDACGRLVLTTQADVLGTAILSLPANLATGLYVVRSGAGPALRLTVE